MRPRRMLGALFGAMLIVLAFAGAAHAMTRTVGTTMDSGSNSLRATIAASSAADTVVLPASAQPYQVSAGEIPITVAPLTIQGASASSSVIDASGGSSRVFHVTATPGTSQTVTFQGVTIMGGTTTTMPGGGGILVDGVSGSIAVNLALVNAVVTGNTATVSTGAHVCCGGGGGIYNNGGSVTLTSSSVTNNTATVTGSTSSGANPACCDGGGGIYDNYSAIMLTGSSVNNNSATVTGYYCCHGGGGIYDDGANGISAISISAASQVSNNSLTVNGTQADIPGVSGPGYLGNCCSGGGGVYQDNNSDVSVLNSAINGNGATINSGQCCHGGGAVYIDGNRGLNVTGSTQGHNTATVNGPSGTNADNHCCSGGGADATFGAETLTSSTLDSNTSSVTAGDCCHGGGAVQIDSKFGVTAGATTISNNQSFVSGGTQSGGGGVYEDTGGATAKSTYANSTISGNSTNAAGFALGGGGLYLLNGSATNPDVLANVTVAGNSAPSGSGGAIYNFGSKLDAKNSIVALNTAATGGDCYKAGAGPLFSSLGYNLEDSPDTCSFTATGDKVVPASSVGLGPLASNGGPTQTRALLVGSPAVDAGDPAGCTDPSGALLTTDQRGFKRPSNGRCDIGAFEFQFSPPGSPPSCTLKAKSNKVLLHPKKKQKPLKDALQLTVNCNQATTISLSGKLTEKKGGKKGKGKTVSLGPLSKTITGGSTATIILKLSKKALNGLKHHIKESVNLTLTATNANGNSSATLKISKLKGTKH